MLCRHTHTSFSRGGLWGTYQCRALLLLRTLLLCLDLAGCYAATHHSYGATSSGACPCRFLRLLPITWRRDQWGMPCCFLRLSLCADMAGCYAYSFFFNLPRSYAVETAVGYTYKP
jgi:hypothetical protein